MNEVKYTKKAKSIWKKSNKARKPDQDQLSLQEDKISK